MGPKRLVDQPRRNTQKIVRMAADIVSMAIMVFCAAVALVLLSKLEGRI